jgi:hypothetical protein
MIMAQMQAVELAKGTRGNWRGKILLAVPE